MKSRKYSLVVGYAVLSLFSNACNEAKKELNKAPESPNSAIALFDGVSFKNWEGDTSYWRIEDSSIRGDVTPAHPLKENSFLVYSGKVPENFELQLEYKISNEGNSGVQYRSEPVAGIPNALKGYQADIDGANVYTGQNYEERGRGFLAMRGQSVEMLTGQPPRQLDSLGSSSELQTYIKQAAWNQLVIRAEKNHLVHFINGNKMSEVFDKDSLLARNNGLIGLQLHVAPQMWVMFRNIQLKPL